MKKIILLLSLFIATFTAALGAVRTVEQAATLAVQFTNEKVAEPNRAPMTAVSFQLVHERAKIQNTEPAFYVFNKADKGGYVIVSGDDRTVDILGYSNQGSFDATNINPNLQFWLNLLQEAVSATNDTNVIHKAPLATTAIDPLLTNKEGQEITWYQESPYNDLCPSDSYGKCMTGCVATAAAMVMYHWCYPIKGTGSHSYTWEKCTLYDRRGDCRQSTAISLSADFENTYYDWENMLPAYMNKSTTTAQKTAVATLMYHAGVACEMEYSSQGSGSCTDWIGAALINYFGYTAEKFITQSSRYSTAMTSEFSVSINEIEEYFNADLEEGLPIIMGGQDKSGDGGHEFVCDGRDENGNFHINWGWEGDGNGFFSLNALQVDDFNFSSGIDAIIGLRPGVVDTIHVDSIRVSPTSQTLKINEKATLTATIQPSTATIKKILWSSSNLNVATVTDGGIVRGIGPGQTTITATTKEGNKTATCTITVIDEFVPSDVFELVTDAAGLQEGDDIIIEATYNNAHYCLSNVMHSTINTSYADCEQVQIVDNAISLSENSKVAVLKLGKQDGAWTLTNAAGQKLGVKGAKKLSLEEGIATWFLNITSGKATLGSTTETYGRILYNNNNNSPRFCNYTTNTSQSMILPRIFARYNSTPIQVVKVTGVEIGQSSAQLLVGNELYLYYAVKPMNATNQSVVWSSSNPAIVAVDPDQHSSEDAKTVLIKGLSEGKATITAQTLDGTFTATCKVTVTKEQIIPTDTIWVKASEGKTIGDKLLAGEQTEQFYGVHGYITYISSSAYQGFWIDDALTRQETFQGFQCSLPEKHQLEVGEYVCIFGYIMNYNNEKIQIKDGTVIVLDEPLALDPIYPVPNAKSQIRKVLDSGQIIFIREGVKYNALGVRLL